MSNDYDERSFEERMQSNFKSRTGVDWSPQATIDNFVLFGPEQRADALDQIDLEISKTDVDDNPNALATAAQRLHLRRELQSLHHKMLQVRR
ncbi:hypothetical protein [Bradyrhizobium sp. B120]|uniref:hypothetical protein n=1 Tax=Bradyrhizobium sp. B120 TaxID=3410088 RepID=UPI003B9815CE